MYFLLKNANIYINNMFKRKNGYWYLKEIDYIPVKDNISVVDLNNYHVFPGLVDVYIRIYYNQVFFIVTPHYFLLNDMNIEDRPAKMV